MQYFRACETSPGGRKIEQPAGRGGAFGFIKKFDQEVAWMAIGPPFFRAHGKTKTWSAQDITGNVLGSHVHPVQGPGQKCRRQGQKAHLDPDPERGKRRHTTSLSPKCNRTMNGRLKQC